MRTIARIPLFNSLWKNYKMLCKPSILFFLNTFNKYNKTLALTHVKAPNYYAVTIHCSLHRIKRTVFSLGELC